MTARVLLVDDDREICEFLVTLLELEGLETRVAHSAAAAMVSLASVDLVLLDVAMPDVDGLEVCRRMRQSGFSGPVLVVSARPGPDLPRGGRQRNWPASASALRGSPTATRRTSRERDPRPETHRA